MLRRRACALGQGHGLCRLDNRPFLLQFQFLVIRARSRQQRANNRSQTPRYRRNTSGLSLMTPAGPSCTMRPLLMM
jgi:hypothetical protein